MITILKDRVLVERHDPEQKTTTGIILPDSQKKTPDRGSIVHMGPLVSFGHESFIGRTIIFQKFAGTEIEHNNKKYLIMKEDEILAIL